MSANTSEKSKDEQELWPLCLCVLATLAFCSWMIWHGNNLRIENLVFKPGIAIEADCTILHRDLKWCNHGTTVSKREYSYLANSTACPEVTLSTAKREQTCRRKNRWNYKNVGEVHKCYIESCESGKFVFEYRANRRDAMTFIVIGGLIACCCSCVGFMWVIVTCDDCCNAIGAASNGKKTVTSVYDVVNNGRRRNTAKNEYASGAGIQWATRLPGPYKPYDMVSKDDETDVEMGTTTHGQEGGIAVTTQ